MYPNLVKSQFQTLEIPCGEALTLRVSANETTSVQLGQAMQWLAEMNRIS